MQKPNFCGLLFECELTQIIRSSDKNTNLVFFMFILKINLNLIQILSVFFYFNNFSLNPNSLDTESPPIGGRITLGEAAYWSASRLIMKLIIH